MRKRVVVLLVLALTALGLASAGAGVPVPDPNFAGTVLPKPCTPDTTNPYEMDQARQEGWDASKNYERYPGACQRLKFVFGPIHVKPGQNDVLLEPITIQK